MTKNVWFLGTVACVIFCLLFFVFAPLGHSHPIQLFNLSKPGFNSNLGTPFTDINTLDNQLLGLAAGAMSERATQLLLASQQINCNDEGIVPVGGNGSAITLTSNPQILLPSDLPTTKQCIVVGTSDTNTLTLADGNGLDLDDRASVTLGLRESATFVFDGTSVWYLIALSEATAGGGGGHGDGTNCSASFGAGGVDANGNAQDCTNYEEELTNTAGLAAAVSEGGTGSGPVVLGTAPTLTSPTISGAVDMGGSVISDDDCTGQQGQYWFDDVDDKFEFCEANSGSPAVLGGGTGGHGDGFNCLPGQAAGGVDANGNAQDCNAYEGELVNTAGLGAAVSEGATGTGAVVLADSPTFTGTVVIAASALPENTHDDSDTASTPDMRMFGDATDTGAGVEDYDLTIATVVNGAMTNHIVIDASVPSVALGSSAHTDIRAETTEGAYSLVRTVKTANWPASAMAAHSNGECSAFAEVDIGSGDDLTRQGEIACPMAGTEVDGYVFGDPVSLPAAFDKTQDMIFRLTARLTTDAGAGTWHGVIQIKCTTPGENVDAAWGTGIGLDLAPIAADTVNDEIQGVSTPVDTDTTGADCDAHDTFRWRWKSCDTDATPSTGCTSSAGFENDMSLILMKVEYTWKFSGG